ncbi:Transcription initiation factor TFIID subunit 13 [Saccharomyces pastorianus]|uniref:Transcription initiation factor TFIID subunit 13 n=1 Tax=Saccharomyces pastorianus TaxID=27292 RepID=A0A6C1EE96_SACPS|nr:Transcription initiation factor TFIID subunit 13 [Saccharomyces pastorianus]
MSRKLKRTNLFNKDVSSLLYAYGDVPQPLHSTVQCLDELVSGYLVDVCNNAFHTAQNSQRNKLRLEDFKFALRNDSVKLGRAEELIATNKLITEAKKQFNETDNQNSLKRYRAEDEEGDEIEEDEDEQLVTDDDEVADRTSSKQHSESKPAKAKKQGTKNSKKTTKKMI